MTVASTEINMEVAAQNSDLGSGNIPGAGSVEAGRRGGD